MKDSSILQVRGQIRGIDLLNLKGKDVPMQGVQLMIPINWVSPRDNRRTFNRMGTKKDKEKQLQHLAKETSYTPDGR